MKKKEELLNFATPLKFIFSHSALREGWDNPNIFQICTLRDIHSERERPRTGLLAASLYNASTWMSNRAAALK